MPDQMAITVPVREHDMFAMLRNRYSAEAGNGRRYVCARHVRSEAGFGESYKAPPRTADFIAVDTWPSSGLAVHGHEVKTSRSDWLRELKQPEKAAAFMPYMTYWWLVISDGSVAARGELPSGWGLLVPRGKKLVVNYHAPKRRPEPMPWTMTVALLRALDKEVPR